MKYIKFLMALAFVCILVMPAFSMPNNGMGDGKQNQCNCQNSMMGQDNKENKWDGNQDKGQNSVEQDGKQKCQKSMMGQDGKENQCNCQNPMMGPIGKDGKENQCNCQNPMMGQDGKEMGHRPIKSMMGMMGKDGKEMCHRPIKSMMGNHDGIKAVIVTVKIIE